MTCFNNNYIDGKNKIKIIWKFVEMRCVDGGKCSEREYTRMRHIKISNSVLLALLLYYFLLSLNHCLLNK